MKQIWGWIPLADMKKRYLCIKMELETVTVIQIDYTWIFCYCVLFQLQEYTERSMPELVTPRRKI